MLLRLSELTLLLLMLLILSSWKLLLTKFMFCLLLRNLLSNTSITLTAALKVSNLSRACSPNNLNTNVKLEMVQNQFLTSNLISAGS